MPPSFRQQNYVAQGLLTPGGHPFTFEGGLLDNLAYSRQHL
jgi:hypothetical protein